MAMNYELAKELKDAGFPGMNELPSRLDTRSWDNEVQARIPAFSELIEACPTVIGDEDSPADFTLRAEGEIWTAGYYGFEDWRQFADGSTPEEAVARLWLALNRHD